MRAVLETVSEISSRRPPDELCLCHALALLEVLATSPATATAPRAIDQDRQVLELTDVVTLAARAGEALLADGAADRILTLYSSYDAHTLPSWAPSFGKTAHAITSGLWREGSEAVWEPFFWLGEALEARGEHDAAAAVQGQGARIAERLARGGWTLQRWFSVVSLASTLGFGLGRTQRAYEMLVEASAAAEEAGVRPIRRAEVGGRMGRMAALMGDDEAAERHFTSAVRVLDSMPRDDAGDSLLAELLDALGGLWRDSPEGGEEATVVLERAIHVRDVLSSSRPWEAGLVVDAALARGNLAAALEAQGRTREALLFANKARDLLLGLAAARDPAVREALAFVELALGRMLLSLGESGSPDRRERLLAGAEAHLEASRALVAPSVGTTHHSVCVIDHLLARVCLATGREARAEELSAGCVKLLDTPECGNLALLGRMYETLAWARSACGRGPLEELAALRRSLELTSMTTVGDVGVGTRALRKRIADLERTVKREQERKRKVEQASQEAALEAFLRAAQWQREVEAARRQGKSIIPPQPRPPAPSRRAAPSAPSASTPASSLMLPAVAAEGLGRSPPRPSPRPPSAPVAASVTTSAASVGTTAAALSPAPSAPASRPSTSMARMLRAVSRTGSSQVGKRQFPQVSPAVPLITQAQKPEWDYDDFVKRYTVEPELTVVEERKQARAERVKRQIRERPKVETAMQIWERRRRIESSSTRDGHG